MGENVRKLVENKIFAEKTFADCSLVLPIVPLEDALKFHGENFRK